MTFQELSDAYWSWMIRHRSKATIDSRKSLIESLWNHPFVHKLAKDVTPFDVEQWLADTKITNPNTQLTRITLVSTIFNWGIKYRLIAENPVANMDRPRQVAREFFIPPDRFKEVLAACPNPEARRLVTFMLDTGARPQEIKSVIPEYFSAEKGTITIPVDESKGRRRQRVIYLGPVSQVTLLAMTSVTKPGQCLLRTPQGRPWSRMNQHRLFQALGEKLGMPALVATTLRHSFAHAKLQAGVPPEIVAKLMGHTNTNQIYRVYGHLDGSKIVTQNAGLL